MGRSYGDPFKGSGGVIQGEPLPPTIFKIVLDAVIRHWETVVEGEEAGKEALEGEYRIWPHYFMRTAVS